MEIGKEEGKPDFGLDHHQEDRIPALPSIPILISWRNNGAERRGAKMSHPLDWEYVPGVRLPPQCLW